MTRTLAVIGVGPGIGMAVARRFGREGHRVALIARSEERLAGHVAELAAAGIEAAAFPADVTYRPQLVESLARAEAELGPIDVMEYGPAPPRDRLAPPRQISVDAALYQLDHAVLGAITAVRQVLPGMLARGDGALLFTTAGSALEPVSFSANFAIAAAGLRSYAHSLHADLAEEGIYAGIVLVAGVVGEREPGGPAAGLPPRLPLVPAAEVADLWWQMATRRDRMEAIAGDMEAVHRALTTAAGARR